MQKDISRNLENKYLSKETYSRFFGKTESRRLQRCCSSAGTTDKKEFYKNAKKGGLKTDVNLKRFPKFSNRISGSSSGENESKIQKSLLFILAPKRS